MFRYFSEFLCHPPIFVDLDTIAWEVSNREPNVENKFTKARRFSWPKIE